MVAAFSKLAEFQFGRYNSNNIFSLQFTWETNSSPVFFVVVVVLAQFANENTLVLHLKISEVSVHAPHFGDFFCSRKRNVLIKAFSKACKYLQWKRDMVSSSNTETWGRGFLLNIFRLDNQILLILEYFRNCLMYWSDHRAWQGFLWD